MLGRAKKELLHIVEEILDTDDSTNAQAGSFCSYDEVSNQFLSPYADKSTMYSTEAAITSLLKRPNQVRFVLNNVIFAKTSRCGKVYKNYPRMHIFL